MDIEQTYDGTVDDLLSEMRDLYEFLAKREMPQPNPYHALNDLITALLEAKA